MKDLKEVSSSPSNESLTSPSNEFVTPPSNWADYHDNQDYPDFYTVKRIR